MRAPKMGAVVEFEPIAVIAAVVVLFALVSARLDSTPITGPMVFVGVGILLGPTGFELVGESLDEGTVRVLAEATLVLLLFSDAARIDLRALRRQITLPSRLLGIGLPLTVLTGGILAVLVFPEYGIWEAALLAAILSPTDAALGQAVVSNLAVPVRIRQALNVESGLNDGLMLPIITVFLALAAVGISLETPGFWFSFAARQVGYGILIGGLAGWAGGRLIDRFSERGWVDGAYRQIATLAVGVGAFATAEVAGGNGFVAAFAAGLAFGFAGGEHCETAADFAEDEGQLLALLTFLLFGAALAGPALGELTWPVALYAALSLTVVRMIPVAIGLIGAGLALPTVAYLGWFGPRGLASILFGLFVLEEADLPIADDLLLVVTWTVLASIVLHGLTSTAWSSRYADWFGAHAAEMAAEALEVEQMRTR